MSARRWRSPVERRAWYFEVLVQDGKRQYWVHLIGRAGEPVFAFKTLLDGGYRRSQACPRRERVENAAIMAVSS